MAQFVFQLDGVIRHRKHLEQERQRELAVIQQDMQRLQDDLRALNNAVAQTNDDFKKNRLIGELDMNFIAAHRRFMNATQRRAILIAQKMTLVQRQVEAAQKQLLEAVKQRKIIEKLREKHKQRWADDINRKELALQDEIGMQMSYSNLRDDDDETEAAES